MSFDEYQDAWQAAGAGAPVQSEVDGLIGGMKRAERKRRTLLGICASHTVVVFGLAVWVLLFRRPLVWNEVLPVLVAQVLLAIGLAKLIGRHRARRKALEAAGKAVREATQAALDNVRGEIRDTRLLLTLVTVSLPLIALAVSQLIASGKMRTQDAWGFALVCTIVVGGIAASQWRKYAHTLAPRRKRLEEILDSLQEGG